MTTREPSTRRTSGMTVLHALYGLGVWASCFVVLYGGLSIGCGTPLAQYGIGPTNGLTALLVMLWLVHVGVLVALVVFILRASGHRAKAGEGDPPRHFMQRLTLLLHTTALVATLAIGLPVLLLMPCV